MLLNDTQNEQKRLAFLLGGSVERYADGGRWRAMLVAVLGIATIAVILFWLVFTLAWT